MSFAVSLFLLIVAVFFKIAESISPGLSAGAGHLSASETSLGPIITAPPHPNLVRHHLYRRKASVPPRDRAACSAVSSIYSLCSSSGFSNLSGTSALASCACYFDQSWIPNIFDGLATNCYNYVRSVQPDAVGGIAPYLNVCFTAGDLSSAFSYGSNACSTVAVILESCANRRNPNSRLTFSGSSSLADCACYASSTIFQPQNFDRIAADCHDFAENEQGQGGNISNLVDFCSRLGDVRANASKGMESCQIFENQYRNCEDIVDTEEQARCLCYRSKTVWAPSVIDQAASSCAGYLRDAGQANATLIESYAGFCESVGNVAITEQETHTPSKVIASPTASIRMGNTTDSSTSQTTGFSSTPGSKTTIPTPSISAPTTESSGYQLPRFRIAFALKLAALVLFTVHII